MSANPILINLVVAHGLEAKPLIALFEMQPSAQGNNIYLSESGLRLIVTGMGRTNVEHSLKKLQAQTSGSIASSAWLNIGIAGHQRLAVGETLLANKITNATDSESVYPSPIISGLQTGALITVDEPELSYPEYAAYDMEAFQFWQAAISTSQLDMVQSYKLISDNPESGTDKVTPALVSELFASASPEIEQLVLQLKGLAAAHQALELDSPEFLLLKQAVHLSVTQEIQMRRLCQRFRALKIEDALKAVAARRHKDGRALISALRTALAEVDWRANREAVGEKTNAEANGGTQGITQ